MYSLREMQKESDRVTGMWHLSPTSSGMIEGNLKQRVLMDACTLAAYKNAMTPHTISMCALFLYFQLFTRAIQ